MSSSQTTALRLGVFGLGFVGDALCRLAQDQDQARDHVVHGFSRRGGVGEGGVFDAGAPDCAQRLDALGTTDFDCAVVTFPPGQAHASFWPALQRRARRRVLLGTTGVYERSPDCSQPVITEETGLVALHPRLPAERAFLESGGHVVRLAGLFGGARNPLQWIRDGRVGYEKRQANLVHRRDVARVVLAVAGLDAPEAIYNVADGQRHTWREIVDALVAQGRLSPMEPQTPKRADGFVSVDRLLADLPGFGFTDFWELLAELASEGVS